MSDLRSLFLGESNTDEALTDSRYILLLIAGNLSAIALVHCLGSWRDGAVPLALAALFLIAALIRAYAVRLGAMVLFTLLLWVDLVLRRNPFSLVYSLIGVYHIYLLWRWRPSPAAPLPPPETPSS